MNTGQSFFKVLMTTERQRLRWWVVEAPRQLISVYNPPKLPLLTPKVMCLANDPLSTVFVQNSHLLYCLQAEGLHLCS